MKTKPVLLKEGKKKIEGKVLDHGDLVMSSCCLKVGWFRYGYYRGTDIGQRIIEGERFDAKEVHTVSMGWGQDHCAVGLGN